MKNFSVGIWIAVGVLFSSIGASGRENDRFNLNSLLTPRAITRLSHSGFYSNSEGSPLITLLESARKSIDIEIYEMGDHSVLSAILGALKRGIQVRIVQEPSPVGSCSLFKSGAINEESTCSELKNFVKEVRKLGGNYVPFNKAELCGVPGKTCFQHGKMVLIDNHEVLISTGNFNSTNLCDLDDHPSVCNRDYSVVTDDPEVVSSLGSIFESDLQGEQYDLNSIIDSGLADKMTVSPISLPDIIAFINSAKQSIQVQNQYLNEPNLNKALVAASRRGIAVEVMVASVCSFGRPSDSKRESTRRTYSEFDRVGISSRFFTKEIRIEGKPGYLHAKAIVVDRERAWVGSMNGSTESAFQNREYGVYFDNLDWVQTLSRIMEDDQNNPNSESWQESIDCVKG